MAEVEEQPDLATPGPSPFRRLCRREARFAAGDGTMHEHPSVSKFTGMRGSANALLISQEGRVGPRGFLPHSLASLALPFIGGPAGVDPQGQLPFSAWISG